ETGAQSMIDHLEARLASGDDSAFALELMNGRTLEFTVQPMENGGMVVLIEDITERKRAEEALHRLNRELQAIRNCDQFLMRATDEQTLLGDICRIVCDKAGYRMAWVGYAELDDAKSVRSVAWAGIEDGYLANANITWDDSERGCGPTGTAIRTGESACIQDFTTDPHASPWRESALQRGYRSSIALPLKDEGQNTFGVLSIYSTEPNAFTTDEKRLPEELAGDLEFGIMVLRTRIERNRAEESLARLNEELEQRVRDRTLLLQQRSEELELANERLKEVDRLKSRFIASMSHELRTPLNAIIGYSSILHDEWPGRVNAEQKQNLASILNSGRHLLDMINDILDVTQIEGGTVTPVVEAFDLYDLLAEAESRVTAAVREKGLELRCEPLRQRMRTDRRRLLQCLLNLLGNAAKFTDKGGVTLEARIVSSPGEEEMVEIAVTDTGIGIGEADLARIFLPFSRIVIPGRTIVPGTGLGLFLSRKISTELLKGDLHVSSEYGRGSRFSLRIPVRLP
ncbi:MAG TPA: ATP-binding protein, partial [Bacteroidota bacterium]